DRCRQLVARARNAAKVLNRRPSLALVHAGRDAADFTDGAAKQRVVPGCVDRRVLRVGIRRRWWREVTPRLRRRRTATAATPSARSARTSGSAEAAEAAAGRLIQLLHLPDVQARTQLL